MTQLSKNGFTNYLRRLCQIAMQRFHPEEYRKLYEQARQDTGVSDKVGRPPKPEIQKRVEQALER